MVFIHPKILWDDTISGNISGEKYNAIRNQQLQFNDGGKWYNIGEDDLPLLPEIILPQEPSTEIITIPAPE
jgi:hypothetical protein